MKISEEKIKEARSIVGRVNISKRWDKATQEDKKKQIKIMNDARTAKIKGKNKVSDLSTDNTCTS